ncbi:amidohydrolase family protein [Methanoculleus sp. FWC-SCC3]|uniref:Dihydroorotase n=1 Tax=Methanoculleus methanifontis TaxID=2584086 RepID=A0ABT8M216_9EURY|nr:dihydroorotase [Methanoculleus sp. FWC-SCC3]MDN7013075.1 amidohydrolase family protein [Methanoculleus sp. FWC-SCC3]
MNADLVLRNVMLPTGRRADIAVVGGIVRHIGAAVRAVETIDCTGYTCLPGAVDMHVHMRGGVQAEKEDWRTGTTSAVAGGVTVVVDQPNTVPPIITPELLRARIREAEEQAVCGFAVNAGVVPEADLGGMWESGAMAFGETFAAPSSYGDGLDAETLRELFARIHALGGVVTVHAEEVSGRAPATLADHDRARSGEGEARAVQKVTGLAPAGLRLHFCHLSTAASVRAARGTVEATPHHLFLSRKNFDPDDTRARVNPPLRDEKTRHELWSCWDRIDVVASDHAPHTVQEKEAPFETAPSGIPGVETMVPLLMAAVQNGRITLASVIEKTSWAPAAILGIPRAGFEPGDRADFALYPDEITRIDASHLHAKCGWSPFEGLEAVFPEEVIVGGTRAYVHGDLRETCAAWYPGQGYLSRENK